MRVLSLMALLLLLTVPAFTGSAQAQEAASVDKTGTLEGILKTNEPDKGTITLILAMPFGEKTLTVADPAAKEWLAKAQKGDIVRLVAADATNPTRLNTLQEIRRPVAKGPRFVALAISLALVCGLAAVMVKGSPLSFLIGADNRYSNSQTQLALWFAALATAYLATVILRFFYLGADYIGGVGITENLLALTGLSALSFGGAKVITTQKIENATQPNQPVPKPPAAQPHLLTDLVLNDRQQADLGDFQMILVTLGAVGVFVFSTFHFLSGLKLALDVTLPDVDSTLLASFGIGQGAYLTKKAALKLGEG